MGWKEEKNREIDREGKEDRSEKKRKGMRRSGRQIRGEEDGKGKEEEWEDRTEEEKSII